MKSKWIKLVTVTFTAILAAPTLMGAVTFHNIVRIYDDSEDSEMVLSQSSDPLVILEEAGITLGEHDVYEFTQTRDRTYTLEIERAFDVAFVCGGVRQTVPMLEGQTVADLLAKAGAVVGEEDILNLPLDTVVTPETQVQLQRVTYETEVVSETIPYETIEQHTPLLKNGRTRQMSAGSDGSKTTTTVKKYIDGVYQETVSEEVVVTKEPVSEVVLYGDSAATVSTLETPAGLQLDANGNPVNYVKKITGKGTAYSARDGAKTASGRYAIPGHVAVNPNVIPYGSKLYIKSADGSFVYGYAVAADTGIALMDGRVTVDLFFDTYVEGVLWGAKTMEFSVWEKTEKTPALPQNGRAGSLPLSLPLFTEIGADFPHPARLIHMEGAAGIAVAASHAVPGLFLQGGVMAPGQRIPGQREVVVFVDEPHVQPGGTGLAVVAVYADPFGFLGCEGPQDRIVLFLRGGCEEAQDAGQILPVPDAGEDSDDAGLVQRILHALIFGQRPVEGRGFRVEQLPAGKRLHHRNRHPFGFAAPVKIEAFVHAADGVIAVAVVISRVDAEHQHIQQAGVQHLLGDFRRVGGKADVPHNAFFLQPADVVQHPVGHHLFQVRLLVDAVQESEIDVIGFQRVQLPGDRTLHVLQLGGPAVLPALVVGAEMNLEIDLLPLPGNRLSEGGEGRGVGGRHVKIVDPVFHGHGHDGFDFLFPGHADGAGPQPDDADLFRSVGQFAVFHNSCPPVFFRPPRCALCGAAFLLLL